ncbi:MAG: exodeoxyribonuclease VII large subunit [Clostridiaceae bacterium]|nr:exodeoxyribonuclease VII large subunit [Clostridiaceae bacterium]
MSDILSVAQLNRYVNDLLSADPNTASVSVSGEISGYKRYPSGHAYFQLKDYEAQVSCVLFRGHFQNLMFEPEDGQKVVVTARASLYEQDGRFQLVVYAMKTDGIGDLFRQFENLKTQLKTEGLFDESHKKRIPFIPNTIGVVTSPKGAVIRDIIHVLSRRYPGFRLILFPSAVQGQDAKNQLREGIEYFDKTGKADVVILARGGGSIEDLWAFNDEELARAIYRSKVPVISAVGHETDFTISDFVADLRAPTPSAAAELVVPDKALLKKRLLEYNKLLNNSIQHFFSRLRGDLETKTSHRALISPKMRFEAEFQRFDSVIYRMNNAFASGMIQKKSFCSILIEKLHALSPNSVLNRGYAIVTDPASNVISDISGVKTGQSIDIRMNNGIIGAEVLRVVSGGENGT